MKVPILLTLALLVVSGSSAAQSASTKEIQEIEFRSLNPRQYEDVVQEKWREITVKGKLFVPNHPISPKAPAMIVLHGSGGISDGRELNYGEKFNRLGMYALVIDSYLSRGVEKMPHARRLFEVSPFAQAADAIAGLNHIAGINAIDESKIGVIGFSFGGVTSYYLNLDNITSKISRTNHKFAANISLYGGCQFSFETPKLTEIPFLLIVGEKDESLDLEVCKKKFNNLNKKDSYSKYLIIPDAHHAWEVNSQLSFRKTINLRDCHTIFTDKGLWLVIRNDGVMAPFNLEKPAGFDKCVKPGYTIGKNPQAEKIADDYIKNFLIEVFK
ncbi:dienelactone hydrolase family protein [Limnohabitans sp.]|uniref:dienelactone hydrolase family protein n=1 Tax=Limnohabitans sp. TaxID=1907725 RepID=UPI0039BD7638|nr:dienelactone hydrolase family protein [Comamonadaceae bacterium]